MACGESSIPVARHDTNTRHGYPVSAWPPERQKSLDLGEQSAFGVQFYITSQLAPPSPEGPITLEPAKVMMSFPQVTQSNLKTFPENEVKNQREVCVLIRRQEK